MAIDPLAPLPPSDSCGQLDQLQTPDSKNPDKLSTSTNCIAGLFNRICSKSERKSTQTVNIHSIPRKSIPASGDRSNFSVFLSNSLTSVKNAFNRFFSLFSINSSKITKKETPIELETQHVETKIEKKEEPLKVETQRVETTKELVETKIEKKERELERQMIQFVTRVEELNNTSKNLMDVFTLKILDGKTPETTAEQFIQALDEASKADPPMSTFTFNGKTVPVDPRNSSSLLKMHKYFTGNNKEQWTEALVDLFAAKDAASQGKTHISKPLEEARKSMNDQDDINLVGTLLMSEVCETVATARTINMEKLERLLNDPRVKESPELTKAVLNAANQVFLKAIRKMQSSVVRSLPIERPVKEAWDNKSHEYAHTEEHLDLNGIHKIAKQAGINLEKQDFTAAEKSLKILNTLLTNYNKFKTSLAPS